MLDDALLRLSTPDFSPIPHDIEHLAVPIGKLLSLSTFASSQRDKPAMLMALPCGMPFDLCQDWFLTLSTQYFVVTWEVVTPAVPAQHHMHTAASA
jgi:hypothetical protein